MRSAFWFEVFNITFIAVLGEERLELVKQMKKRTKCADFAFAFPLYSLCFTNSSLRCLNYHKDFAGT